MASTPGLTEARCGCHRLLLKVSSTSNALFEIKCPRCGGIVEMSASYGTVTAKAA